MVRSSRRGSVGRLVPNLRSDLGSFSGERPGLRIRSFSARSVPARRDNHSLRNRLVERYHEESVRRAMRTFAPRRISASSSSTNRCTDLRRLRIRRFQLPSLPPVDRRDFSQNSHDVHRGTSLFQASAIPQALAPAARTSPRDARLLVQRVRQSVRHRSWLPNTGSRVL